jgi:hypothetical protein
MLANRLGREGEVEERRGEERRGEVRARLTSKRRDTLALSSY